MGIRKMSPKLKLSETSMPLKITVRTRLGSLRDEDALAELDAYRDPQLLGATAAFSDITGALETGCVFLKKTHGSVAASAQKTPHSAGRVVVVNVKLFPVRFLTEHA